MPNIVFRHHFQRHNVHFCRFQTCGRDLQTCGRFRPFRLVVHSVSDKWYAPVQVSENIRCSIGIHDVQTEEQEVLKE